MNFLSHFLRPSTISFSYIPMSKRKCRVLPCSLLCILLYQGPASLEHPPSLMLPSGFRVRTEGTKLLVSKKGKSHKMLHTMPRYHV